MLYKFVHPTLSNKKVCWNKRHLLPTYPRSRQPGLQPHAFVALLCVIWSPALGPAVPGVNKGKAG